MLILGKPLEGYRIHPWTSCTIIWAPAYLFASLDPIFPSMCFDLTPECTYPSSCSGRAWVIGPSYVCYLMISFLFICMVVSMQYAISLSFFLQDLFPTYILHRDCQNFLIYGSLYWYSGVLFITYAKVSICSLCCCGLIFITCFCINKTSSCAFW